MTKEPEAITTIDLVERGIEHLNKLTVDVTQFSRRRQLSLAEVDLDELLNTSLDLVSEKISEKHTSVEKNYSKKSLRARWDVDQLRQVFVNLFANAIDASPPYESIIISTEYTESLELSMRHEDGGRAVKVAKITVADSGSGMNEATRTRIFEPFFTTKKRGTGLGLAIVKKIVEQHGGTITVESAPGEGTSFHVELPLNHRS